MKARLVALYGVKEGVVCGLFYGKGLFVYSKIIYTSPAFLEYYPCDIVKVYVDGWVQFCVDGDTEVGCHCGKIECVYEVLLIK